MKKVLHNNILAEELESKELESGIVLADTVETKKMRYKVAGIGDKVEDVEVGDVVYVPNTIGRNARSIVVDGTEYTVLSESQIVMVER